MADCTRLENGRGSKALRRFESCTLRQVFTFVSSSGQGHHALTVEIPGSNPGTNTNLRSHRLTVQDASLSSSRHGFESRWEHHFR